MRFLGTWNSLRLLGLGIWLVIRMFLPAEPESRESRDVVGVASRPPYSCFEPLAQATAAWRPPPQKPREAAVPIGCSDCPLHSPVIRLIAVLFLTRG